jgi:hypothetical protein
LFYLTEFCYEAIPAPSVERVAPTKMLDQNLKSKTYHDMADDVMRLKQLMSSVLSWMDMDMPTEYRRPWGHCADDFEMKMSVNVLKW